MGHVLKLKPLAERREQDRMVSYDVTAAHRMHPDFFFRALADHSSPAVDDRLSYDIPNADAAISPSLRAVPLGASF